MIVMEMLNIQFEFDRVKVGTLRIMTKFNKVRYVA